MTGRSSTVACAAASSSPAAKLASKAHRLVLGSHEPVATAQYPAGALCTELWKRVGDTSRPSVASTHRISCTVSPSPPDDVNTIAIVAGSRPACASASTGDADGQSDRTAGAPPLGRRQQGDRLRNELARARTAPNPPTRAVPRSSRSILGPRRQCLRRTRVINAPGPVRGCNCCRRSRTSCSARGRPAPARRSTDNGRETQDRSFRYADCRAAGCAGSPVPK